MAIHPVAGFRIVDINHLPEASPILQSIEIKGIGHEPQARATIPSSALWLNTYRSLRQFCGPTDRHAPSCEATDGDDTCRLRTPDARPP